MSEERFLWNKDRTEMVRVGVIKQITITEIGGGAYATVPAERAPKKPAVEKEKANWVVRAHLLQSPDTCVMGLFDTVDEARQFAEGLQRYAEGRDKDALPLPQGVGPKRVRPLF